MARPAATYRPARREAWKVQYRKTRAPWRGIVYKPRATNREMPRIYAMPPPRYVPYAP